MIISINSLIYALNYVSIHQCTDSNYGFKHKKRFETVFSTVSNHYFLYGAQNQNRTGTTGKGRKILSLVRLPIPPSGQRW